MNNDMNVHGLLKLWTDWIPATDPSEQAEAKNSKELVGRILGPNTAVNSAAVRKVSGIVENILNDKQDELRRSDLPALKKLKDLIANLPARTDWSSLWRSGRLPQLERKLRNVIEKLEKIPSEPSDVFPSSFIPPSNILDIITGYLPLEDQKKIGIDDPEDLATTLKTLHRSNSQDPEIPRLIRRFFLRANSEQQDLFFHQLGVDKAPDTGALLLQLIDALPQKMTHLKLTHAASYIGDAHLQSIVNRLTNLQQLDLSWCSSVTDEGIRALAESQHMANLQQLNLRWCSSVTDEGIRALAESEHMANLQQLNLSACDSVTDEGIRALAESEHMANLQQLDLDSCGSVTDEGIRALAESEHMANLQQLNLSGCRRVTDKSIRALAESEHMANLRQLNLGSCDSITDEGIRALAESQHMANLQQLNLRWCSSVTDEGIRALAESEHMANLQQLDLSFCSSVTDEGIRALAESEHMANLQQLNLRGCNSVTDEGIRALAESEHMANLQQLNLSLCSSVTDEGIRALAESEHMANLQQLDLSWCSSVTDEGIRALAESEHMANLERVLFRNNTLTRADLLKFKNRDEGGVEEKE